MEDFVTRVEKGVQTAIDELKEVKTLLQNGDPVRKPITKIRRNLADLEADIISKTAR